ncbi:hypothetical protein K9M59_00790 [Candidatus Gracilibacteria bacterium]|nr:hypothetical protein [Candidatus Gracilibacteria bacterium]MCF7819114.1 hypothetical protein [Candidatus Gracilibacteria bacterium]
MKNQLIVAQSKQNPNAGLKIFSAAVHEDGTAESSGHTFKRGEWQELKSFVRMKLRTKNLELVVDKNDELFVKLPLKNEEPTIPEFNPEKLDLKNIVNISNVYIEKGAIVIALELKKP